MRDFRGLYYETCPGCGSRRRIEFDTDGHGRLVEISRQCACIRLARTRRQALRPGECLDCSAPVESPRHGRCEMCKRLKRNATKREWRRANAEKFRRERRAWEAANPERMERHRIRVRDRARKYGPDNLPSCRKCGGPVPFKGPGAPRRECPACRVGGGSYMIRFDQTETATEPERIV